MQKAKPKPPVPEFHVPPPVTLGPQLKSPPPPGSPNRHDARPPTGNTHEQLQQALVEGAVLGVDDIIITRADGPQFLHGHDVEVVSNLGETLESQTSSQAQRNYDRLLEEGARRYPDLPPHVAAELVAADEEGIRTDPSDDSPQPTGLPGAVYLSSDDGHPGTGAWILPDGTSTRVLPDGTRIFEGMEDVNP